jgi:phosphate-selective porin OprO and OprP
MRSASGGAWALSLIPMILDEFDDFGNWNVSARLAGTPIYQDKGRRLLLIGAAYSHQFRNDNDDNTGVTGPLFFRYRQRPEIHITDARTLDTLDFLANGADVFNAQSALVLGSFSIQAEYFLSATNATKQANRGLGIVPPFEANPTFQGAYAYVSYFLTGEHRPYSQSSGAFTRVKPINNFDPSRGTWGAFEVAARWSYVTLNSKGIAGGIENNFTFGLNWYLNQNARWMFNYIFADLDKRRNILTPNINDTFAGKSHIVGTRFQVDF